ncbi:MAG: fibronectin type III domain-containing protein [Clostridia bacterium]|nr:fibronectin type III domain-containing protein [Clostridia bacterium]
MISREDWKKFRGSQKMPDHIMLSVNGNPETSMTVTWRTCTDIAEGYALCREAGTDEWLRFDAEKGNFESDMDSSHIFWANMTGLKPDTKYEYNVGNADFRSENYSFTTIPENLDDFKFICLSDIQTGGPNPPADYSDFNLFLKETLKKHPDVRFILTAGDNTNCGQTDIQWTGTLEGFKGVMEYMPLMMSMGNHDDMGFKNYFTFEGKYYSEKAEYFSNQFRGSYPYNGPEDWKTASYSFDYGNAHFAAIGISGPEDVNEWLIKDTDASDKTWKFGSHHFPICYAGSDLACDDSYPMMMEGMEKFDVMFSGHEHCFSRSYPRRNENLYDKPSEGTVFYNLGSGNRNPSRMLALPKIWNTAWYPHEEELSMYAIAHVSKNKLTLTSYLEDGRVADRCVIDKETDSIEPVSLAPIYTDTRMMFKGADLGLCARTTPGENIDGVWHIPAAILFRYAGFKVELSEGKVYIEAYRHNAEFAENSDIAITDRGEIKLGHKVVRLHRDQLYVPVDGICKAFDMRCNYYTRNNILSFEHEKQDKPVPFQP